jgi:DNA-binding IclR family transcriptional regulator
MVRKSTQITSSRTGALPAPTPGTQSVSRAVSILRHVAAHDVGGVRLIDIQTALKLDRSTAHRILQCLFSEGFLARRHPGQRYVLGPLAFELGLRAAGRETLRGLCRPHLQRIAEETGDVVFLSVRSGLETVCIDRAEGDYPIKAYTRRVGDRRPIGFGVVGIAMLALLPDSEVQDTLERSADALAAFSNEEVTDALARIAVAKNRGYALHERNTLGLRAIAVPIRNPQGAPFAAISLCAIASRLKAQRIPELVALLKDEATAIEQALIAKSTAVGAAR